MEKNQTSNDKGSDISLALEPGKKMILKTTNIGGKNACGGHNH